MRSAATVKDIARMVGVSATTVSYVLNNNPKQSISTQTTQKILDAAKKLHYIPNNAAKTLRSSQSFIIGVAVQKNIVVPRINEEIQGIRDVLTDNEYDLMLCSESMLKGLYPDYLNKYYEGKIDGIIYIGSDNEGLKPDVVREIEHNQVPLVAFDCKSEGLSYSTVDIDYFSGAYEMARMLCRKGAGHIVYLRPEMQFLQEQEREEGVRASIEEQPGCRLQVYKVPINKTDLTKIDSPRVNDVMEYNQFLRSFVERQMGEEIDSLGDGDAIICSWGSMVETVLSYVLRKGRNVNVASLARGTVRPVCWDNYFCSSLPNYSAGTACAQAILDRLKDRKNIRHIVLKPSV